MLWHELTIHTTEEAVEMITNFLHEAGAGGVSIEESGTTNKKRDTSLDSGLMRSFRLTIFLKGKPLSKGTLMRR